MDYVKRWKQVQAMREPLADDEQDTECPYCHNVYRGTSTEDVLRKHKDYCESWPDEDDKPQYGYHSWSPEERAEYDRMYDR